MEVKITHITKRGNCYSMLVEDMFYEDLVTLYRALQLTASNNTITSQEKIH